MIRDLATLKALFNNRNEPDQAAFADLIDTLGQLPVTSTVGLWVTQTHHGFSLGQPLRLDWTGGTGTTTTSTTTYPPGYVLLPTYALACGNNPASSKVVGVVGAIDGSNRFFLAVRGVILLTATTITTLLGSGTALAPGAMYYLDQNPLHLGRLVTPAPGSGVVLPVFFALSDKAAIIQTNGSNLP